MAAYVDRVAAETNKASAVTAATAAENAAAAAAAASASRDDDPRHAGLNEMERWAVQLVNAEFARSKQGRWRRLLPCARSSDYWQFLEPAHRMHQLPFEV